MKSIIIIGAGGHAKVIMDIILKNGNKLLGFLDDNKQTGDLILGYPVLGKIDICERYQEMNEELEYIVAIGNNILREEISEKYKLKYHIAVHPQAIIGMDVKILEGTAVMANVVINSSTTIHKHCIINTGSIVEHDCIINSYAHLAPNATLGGTVTVGKAVHIGIGATIINNISITDNVIVGAGAVVVNDLLLRNTYIGIPAKLADRDNSICVKNSITYL